MFDLKTKSKFLALILRHKPEKANIILDKEGWTSVEILCANTDLNVDELEEIVKTDDKGRYAFNLDKSKIRAVQGHSNNLDIVLKLKKEIPPAILYHGTKEDFLPSILKKGLLKGNRQYVHLSNDYNTAKNVADRKKGKSVILKIDAMQMYAKEFKFYLTENNVWLIDYVPAAYLLIDNSEKLK